MALAHLKMDQELNHPVVGVGGLQLDGELEEILNEEGNIIIADLAFIYSL